MKKLLTVIIAYVCMCTSCSPRYTQLELQDIEVIKFLIPYAKENNLEIITFDDPDVPFGRCRSLSGFLLNSNKEVELQEARTIVVSLYVEMTATINKSLSEQRQGMKGKQCINKNSVFLAPEIFRFRIDFWTRRYNRFPKPYISQIVFRQGTVYYYQADATTMKLELVAVETIQEAISIATSSQE